MAKYWRTRIVGTGILSLVSEMPVYGVNYTDSTGWEEYPFDDHVGYSEIDGFWQFKSADFQLGERQIEKTNLYPMLKRGTAPRLSIALRYSGLPLALQL